MIAINVVDDANDVVDVLCFVAVGDVCVEEEVLLLMMMECYNLTCGAVICAHNGCLEACVSHCYVAMVNNMTICIVGIWIA